MNTLSRKNISPFPRIFLRRVRKYCVSTHRDIILYYTYTYKNVRQRSVRLRDYVNRGAITHRPSLFILPIDTNFPFFFFVYLFIYLRLRIKISGNFAETAGRCFIQMRIRAENRVQKFAEQTNMTRIETHKLNPRHVNAFNLN